MHFYSKKAIQVSSRVWYSWITKLWKTAWRYLLLVNFIFGLSVFTGALFFWAFEDCTCSYGEWRVEGCEETDYETCIDTGGYHKTFIQALYMSVITLTTVGFGDKAPRSYKGRVFAIFWMMAGITAKTIWMSAWASYFFDVKEEERFDLSNMEDVNEELFADMDLNNKGFLTLADYRGYMLVRHGLVSQDVLGALDAQFNAMDRQGLGKITMQQIAGMQQDMVRQKST